MRNVVWFFGWIGVAVWSLFSWAAWAFFDLFARMVRDSGTDVVSGFPDEPAAIVSLIDFLHGLGGFVFFVVWALVAAALLGVTWLIGRIFPGKPALARSPYGSDRLPR